MIIFILTSLNVQAQEEFSIYPDGKTVIRHSGNAIQNDSVDISNLSLILERGSNATGRAIGLGFQSSSTNTTIGGAIIFERTGSSSKGHLHFATKSSSNADEDIPIRMTIEDNGNVGIGISDPSERLHVNGLIKAEDGIILPLVPTINLPAVSTPGHVLYNSNHNRLELFTQNFQWEGINGDQLIDADHDSKIILMEGLTVGSRDFMDFQLDNQSMMTLSSNASGIPRINLRGGGNSFIGSNTGRDATTDADNNIAIGSYALANIVTADNNIAIGTDALSNTDMGQNNTGFGSNNVAIGHKALENADRFALGNTAVGFEAGHTGGGDKSVFLGYQAGKKATKLSQALYISNTEGDDPLIYGEFDNKLVRVNGDLQTEDGSIFMRNLGSTDTDQGLKWGEGANSAIFGLVYDGSGSGSQSKLYLREYNSVDTDVMTFKANGNVGIGVNNPETKLDINGLLRLQPQALNGNECNDASEVGRLMFDQGTQKLTVCTNTGWVFVH